MRSISKCTHKTLFLFLFLPLMLFNSQSTGFAQGRGWWDYGVEWQGDFYIGSVEHDVVFNYPNIFVQNTSNVRVHKVISNNEQNTIALVHINNDQPYGNDFFLFNSNISAFAARRRLYFAELTNDSLITQSSLYGYFNAGHYLSADSLLFSGYPLSSAWTCFKILNVCIL